jgi:glutamate racemase
MYLISCLVKDSFFYFNKMNNSPIGIFDSGIGGLSILKEINRVLPNENTIYLADNKNCPYGNKDISDIIKLSLKNASVLIKMNCKIIVVACNTATTNAIKEIRNSFTVPVIGIEPAIKPAILNTKTNKIGVLATEMTLTSNLFNQTSNKFSDNIEIIEQIGFGLVNLIEKGDINKGNTKQLLKSYIDPMLDLNIDQLVLGCTHYHFLIPIIRQIMPEKITIQDPNKAIAKQIKKILKSENLENTLKSNCKNKVYANGNTEIINNIINSNGEVNSLDF